MDSLAAPAGESAAQSAPVAGRYQVLGELGRGGAGAVYRARDETSGRVVALKVLGARDARLTRLFEREYHTLASLKHPSVIEVYDFGIGAQGQRFYTMELLSGADLQQLAPLPYRRACAHLRDAANCLALLHARRLLHRDVSPSNLRLDSAGRTKLIDFGALGDFGLPREIVGTPPFMPPEALHKLPLDQRSDLFSLGATLYFALTKRLPFAVHRIRDLDVAQRTAPPPPSSFAPDIPEALDHLVLSLLSVDPSKRPSSAAEVIERLGAIGDLEAERSPAIADSYLLSSALIGRAREKRQLQPHVERAMRGAGSVVIIEGASGMGRTRLASELCTDARIAGLTTLRVDALARPESAGALRALASGLLEAAPQEATASRSKYAGVLGQDFEALRAVTDARSDRSGSSPPAADRKALIQRTFVQWLLDACASRPLLVVVDNAHAVDTESAGALVLLAHAAPSARLLMAITKERDAPAPVPIQQLSRVAARVRLHSLDGLGIEQLIASVFGDVPHRARLAQWLTAAGRGNPGHSLELLKQLVERGVIRYGAGVWALPASLPEQELPKGVDDALQARARAMDDDAKRFARLFALHRGALPLRACLELGCHQTAAQVVATLDQLVGQDVLVRSDDAYRFGREAMRAGVLFEVSSEERQRLHGALANALASARPELFAAAARRDLSAISTVDLGLLLQAASHIERSGDEQRGRALMYEPAIELTLRGDGLGEAVPALEAAIAEYRRTGGPSYNLVPLLVPLTLAGTYSDFRLSYRYGDETLDVLLDLTGLRWTERLRPIVGGHLALWLGLVMGFVRFHYLAIDTRAKSSFRELLLGLIGIGTALLGTCSVLMDKARAERIAQRLESLRYFPAGHAVRWVHGLQNSLFAVTVGDIARACDHAMRTYEALRDKRRVPGIPGEARLQLLVGCLTPLSLAYTLRVDGKVHTVLDALDRLHTSVSRQIAAGSRAVYHGHRGERSQFMAYHELMDVLASQAGSTWREDAGMPRQMWSSYMLCEDVLGLKRAAHDLEELARELPSLRTMRDVTHACYLCERGMYDQALRDYRQVLEAAASERSLQGVRYAGAYARILRVAGEPERARQVCAEALSLLQPAEREFRVATFGAELELSLATAALGALPEAAEQLEQLIEAQCDHDNPLLHGLAHKARAQVAVLQRDPKMFAEHLDQMESWFRRADNPALIGQCQRLVEQAKLAGVAQPERSVVGADLPSTTELAHVTVALGACRGPVERLDAAIELLLCASGAERGYLYLLEPAGLRFAAPAVGEEPPESLRRALNDQIGRACAQPAARLSEAALDIGVHDEQPPDAVLGDQARLQCTSLVLAFTRDGELVVVGAIALVRGPQPLTLPQQSLLEAIAHAIYTAGDVRTVYFDTQQPPGTSPFCATRHRCQRAGMR